MGRDDTPPFIREYDAGSCKFTTPQYRVDNENLRVGREQESSFLSFKGQQAPQLISHSHDQNDRDDSRTEEQ